MKDVIVYQAHHLGTSVSTIGFMARFTESVPEACQLREGLLLLAGGNLGSTDLLSKEI